VPREKYSVTFQLIVISCACCCPVKAINMAFASCWSNSSEICFARRDCCLSLFCSQRNYMSMFIISNTVNTHTEHSEPAQNCDDDGGRLLIIAFDNHDQILRVLSLLSSVIQLQSFINTEDAPCQQERRLLAIFVNTVPLLWPELLLLIIDMYKPTFTCSAESLERPHRIMLPHLSTSTSVRAVDDLQSN
jgi:hypothetical protein